MKYYYNQLEKINYIIHENVKDAKLMVLKDSVVILKIL